MKKVILTVLTVIAAAVVALEGFYLVRLFTGNSPDHPVTVIQVDATLPSQPEAPTDESTVPETTVEETTVPETTEPEPIIYTLSFAGDCTLGTEPGVYGAGYTFVGTVKDDYAYPFANVKDIFSQDDFTFVNLEGVFCENGFKTEFAEHFYTQLLFVSAVRLAEDAARKTYNSDLIAFFQWLRVYHCEVLSLLVA